LERNQSSHFIKEHLMNSLWLSNLEILMEERRADFRREMEQLRLEREAISTKPHKLNWLERRMHDFSMWMMYTGERMHRRYHDPAPRPRWYQSFKVAR
jgi:hypothetical protein